MKPLGLEEVSKDMVNKVEVILTENVDLKGSVFVTGFAGFGGTGYIATKHLVEQLNMRRIGFVKTRYVPEITWLSNYGIAMPFEIFYHDASKLVVLLNHGEIHERERSVYADVVTSWIKSVGARLVILIGGLDKQYKKGDEKLRWLATSKCEIKLDDPMMDKGLYIVGPLALMILFSEMKGIPALVILPYAEAMRPDPLAAAVAVEKISEIIGVEVDTSKLREDARIIEEELKRMDEYQERLTKMRQESRLYM